MLIVRLGLYSKSCAKQNSFVNTKVKTAGLLILVQAKSYGQAF